MCISKCRTWRHYLCQTTTRFCKGDIYTDHCYVLDKAIYGLKQATRFLKQSNLKQGLVDPTVFWNKEGEQLMIVQIYADDIIFRSTIPKLTNEFQKLMKTKF